MFEHTFKTQLDAITSDKSLIDDLWDEIRRNYAEAGRHYHNLSHLDNLISELIPVKDKILDWQTIIFAIAYHDIIYNTLKTDNEEKSAEVAQKRLSRLALSNAQIEKCCLQILATKTHTVTDDNDTNFFTDADLSILGADEEQYHKYSEMIRKEYKLYPDFVYKPGRQKVLRHFVEMPFIYKTEYFRGKYETRAKQNINSELKELS